MNNVLPKDVPNTLTIAKAKSLRSKSRKVTTSIIDCLKSDLLIEMNIIVEHGEEHTEYSDIIKHHVSDIRWALRNYINVERRIKKAVNAHIKKTQGSNPKTSKR